ncbi:methionyl-tRNA formyltransferase, putative [Cryptococcus deneoformans JEC21]|uniref:methionyl-tRNA formyltransferase n=2 Tax=Cryptococcus deneoformans TaxID=40410 RepID=Q5KGC2_CRYD1|nr:methionyl-tRNA formyltransferase, putative [Cryptococcus neoformans var. neoformans JEC21]AAW43762.2 methionyl-tRNA formyltransferase, putative [Cryptococcus neoformans var. neoformans JEC21]
MMLANQPFLLRIPLKRQAKTRSFCCFSATCKRRTAKKPFRILFCGSDDFSVASLKAVYEAKDVWSSIDVVVPAEREIGRGGKHAHHEKYTPALRLYAEQNNLPVSTIPSTGLKAWSPPEPFTSSDLNSSHMLLTASFGHIIPLRLLKLFPPIQRLNVHPSLLPRWRGAAPLQWTIASGDEETGVSVQTLVRYALGVDAGDILGRAEGIKVPHDTRYETLLPSLAGAGGKLLVDVLRKIQNGTVTTAAQDERYITLAPKITHETSRIDWEKHTAEMIDRLHRGFTHQYPLWTSFLDTTAQILSLHPIPRLSLPMPLYQPEAITPGTGILYRQGKSRRLFVACAGDSWLEVQEIKAAGKKALGIKEWWNGLPKHVRESGKVTFR